MKFAEKNDGRDGFDLGQVLEFCRKNIRYISAAVIVVVLVIVLAVTAARSKKDTTDQEEAGGAKTEEIQQGEEETEDQDTPQAPEFAVDAIPEINTLVQNYYTAYAAGDIAGLEACATPFSELEKNYIGLTNQYIGGYENIHCYSKPGMNEGEYAVSVVSDMRLKDVETLSPTLNFFYVRTNEAGAYYIDNIYSDFNTKNRVLEFDSQVEAFIQEYESQEDVVALAADIQSRCDAALASDEKLKDMAENVIPTAVQEWVNQLVARAENNPAQPEAPAEPAQEPTQPETPTQDPAQTPEETPETPPAQEPETQPETPPAQEEGQGTPQVNYVPEGKVLTANQGYNVRKSMSEDAERIGTTAVGDEIKVILSYAEGWTKVEWNGTTGYIRTDLLLAN